MVCKEKYESLVPPFNTKMDPQAVIKPMVLEDPSDFDVAVRVARRMFKLKHFRNRFRCK